MKKLYSLICLLFFVVPVLAEEQKFLRLETEQGKTVSLQTAIVVYEKDGVTVDLIGAIHVGDKAYYKTLNKKMEGYDALLYELVAPRGKVPERGQGSIMALIAKFALDLDHQIERVNYKKNNFIHADLSFEEMKEVMEKRGDTPLILGLRVLADALQQQEKAKKNPVPAALIGIELANAENALDVKRVMAKVLAQQVDDGTLAALKTVLIDDRNARAMEVLQDQFKLGKKRMGIFYGAAHMKDFDARLQALGFKPKETGWVTAWDLSDD